MQAFLKTALEITQKAEGIALSHFRQGVGISQKADESPVTIADRETEAYIRAGLHDSFPDHGIIGEEYEEKQTDSQYQWIIDPIDGTRAFISGLPLFGMLIGLLKDGEPVLGVVRMPGLAEVYTGDGLLADLGDQPLEVSEVEDLSQAMLYINEADKILRDAPDVFARLNIAGRDRRFSYDCYPHMLVAAGHVDACVDFDLKPYDYLPMVPIVEGADGVITDWDGAPLGLHSDGRVLSAATPALHAELLALLQGA